MSIIFFCTDKIDQKYLYTKGYLGLKTVSDINCWYYNIYDSEHMKRAGELDKVHSLKEVKSPLQFDDDLWKCYLNLKSHFPGSWISDGFSYGFHFTVYLQEPDFSHSSYLVYLVKEPSISAAELITLGRAGHAVKKNIILTTTNSNKLKHLSFENVKQD